MVIPDVEINVSFRGEVNYPFVPKPKGWRSLVVTTVYTSTDTISVDQK